MAEPLNRGLQMAIRRPSGLGRGLDALLPEPLETERPPVSGAAELAIHELHRNPQQPRTRIREEGLDELAQSIRAQGVIEPIVVRPRASGGFEIIAGERRWRAAERAGLMSVPAVVRDVDDRQALAMALIENIQREDLGPLEEARAMQALLSEYQLTHGELAEAVGKSRAAVTNTLRLLKLAPGASDLLDSGALEMGHARALLPLPTADQEVLARRIAAQGLSVRQAEALVKRLLNGGESPARNEADPDTRRLERHLSERLGARTTITGGKGGKGRIVIRYGSLDELDGVLARMGAGRL